MNCNKWLAVFVLCLTVFLFARDASADENPKVLMIYMTEDGQFTVNSYWMEMLLATAASAPDTLPVHEVKDGDLSGYDAIVFIGDAEGRIPSVLRKEFKKYRGRIVAAGHNAGQLSPFRDWQFGNEQLIRRLDGEPLSQGFKAVTANAPEGSRILSSGRTLNEDMPFIIQSGRLSYIASASRNEKSKFVISEHLHKLLGTPAPETHPAYIRLEGISPLSDADEVKDAGHLLADRNIPFLLSVSPSYIDPDTGQQTPLSKNKELVSVLRSLQELGGSIVADGSSFFRKPDGNADRKESEFRNPADYKQAQQSAKQAEEQFVEASAENVIESLVYERLYPVAFKAYPMNAPGYAAAARHFSSLFGAVQLSDGDDALQDMPPAVSASSRLNGLAWYPDTVGAPDISADEPFERVSKQLERLQEIPGSVFGAVYYPSDGEQLLEQFIWKLESVPSMTWIDFSATVQHTRSEHVQIRQSADGLQVNSDLSRFSRFLKELKASPFDMALWAVAAVVVLFLLSFAINVFSLQVRLRKRLFKERDTFD